MPLYALDGRSPTLPASGRCWIAPDATVIGDVVIGEDVSIWFGAILRGDNDRIEIGAASNIQDGAMLHTDQGIRLVVGAGVTVGHHAILHGCRIGDRSLVGMGATILNRASIGAHCIVGANALVREGEAFPECSLIVGAPAARKRPLSAAQIAALDAGAAQYVERGRLYARGLTRVD